jgi:hypothetical protein
VGHTRFIPARICYNDGIAKPSATRSQSTKIAEAQNQSSDATKDDSHLAFEQFVKQYQHRVLRTIASIISDEEAAQDVAQETFLSAWSDLPKLKEKQKFGRWLTQIAISFTGGKAVSEVWVMENFLPRF